MESELIAYLRQRIPSHPLVRLGLGDDAAVLQIPAHRVVQLGLDPDSPALRTSETVECVITVDMLMDGVDFRLSEIDPRRAGRKALAVNLSDLAAMASAPLAGVVALALPRSGGMELAVALYEGILPLAEQYGLSIAGGDTNSWDGPLVVSVTLVGKATPRGPLCRSGARPSDRIVVTGAFGGSILGRHLDFEPRVYEAIHLVHRYRLHAGIDVSDGLSLDLGRLAQESGCGAVLDLGSIPVSEDARRWAAQLADGSTALDHALADGEDFELILAVPPEEAERMLAEQPLEVPLTMIGQFIEQPGLWQADASGGRIPLMPRGYEHKFD